MLKKIVAAVPVMLGIVFFIAVGEAREILVPVDHFPPYQIVSPDREKTYGEVISILEAVVAAVNREGNFALTLKTTEDLPFKRCLQMMKSGNAQLIGGLLDKDDRREYMHLLRYKPNSHKVFVVSREEGWDFRELAELKGKSVGVVHGYRYFEAFDGDGTIFKDPAPNFGLSLKKLLRKRFPAAICTENEWLALKAKNPALAAKLKTATYRYNKPNPVYLGISKNSWLARPPYLETFRKVMERMYREREFVTIAADFYECYGLALAP